MANEDHGTLTTAPPDDDFDNALAVFHHDIRAIMSEADCQTVIDRIGAVHASWPEMPFDDAAELVRATMAGRASMRLGCRDDDPPVPQVPRGQLVNLGTFWEELLARPCGHSADGGDCNGDCADGKAWAGW